MRSNVCVLLLVALLATACAEHVVVSSPQVQSPALALRDPSPAGLDASGQLDPAVEPSVVPVEPGTLSWAVVGDLVFDPLETSVVDPAQIAVLDLVYDGLTVWDTALGEAVPELAASLDEAADGLSWSVGLNPAAFSDGTPLLATDVERSLERVLADDSLAGDRLRVIADVAVVGDHQLRLEMAEPFALLPELLSSPVFGVVPDGVLDGSVGSGPMAFDGVAQLLPVESLVGVASVSLAVVATEGDAISLYDAGIVDLVYVSTAYEGAVDASRPSSVETHFVFNTLAPELSDPSDREAVISSIGRAEVAKSGFGAGAAPVDQLQPEMLACADPCGGEDPETVATPTELAVAYVEDPSGREAHLAGSVAVQLSAVGTPAVSEPYDLAGLVELISTGGHHIVRSGWVGLFPSADSQLAPYLSDGAENISGFSDPEFDTLFLDARTTGDPKLYKQAEARLREAAVVVPIARLLIRALVSDDVQDITIRHDGSIDLEGLRVVD